MCVFFFSIQCFLCLMFPHLFFWWQWFCHTRSSVLFLSIELKESTGLQLILLTLKVVFVTMHPEMKETTFLVVVTQPSVSRMCSRKEPCSTLIPDCCWFILLFNHRFAMCLWIYLQHTFTFVFSYFVLFIDNYFKQLHFQSYLKIKL